jgi:hypothetical protein
MKGRERAYNLSIGEPFRQNTVFCRNFLLNLEVTNLNCPDGADFFYGGTKKLFQRYFITGFSCSLDQHLEFI